MAYGLLSSPVLREILLEVTHLRMSDVVPRANFDSQEPIAALIKAWGIFDCDQSSARSREGAIWWWLMHGLHNRADAAQ